MKACGHRFNLMSAEMLRLRGPNEEFLANNQAKIKFVLELLTNLVLYPFLTLCNGNFIEYNKYQ